jgi:type III secretion protein J
MNRTVLGSRRARCAALCIALALSGLLAGCEKELYGNLNEHDCNEIVAALLEAGIHAEKSTSDGGKTWSAMVDDGQIVHAMQVLNEHGLPARRFTDLGDLFKQDGLVSTPTEERVRYIYGLSQELSETMSKFDGVVVARVHIVLPENDPLATTIKPSSASVFIKYQPGANLATLMPQIKNLVVDSVEGLQYDRVSVTLVQADPLKLEAAPPTATRRLTAGLIAGALAVVLAVVLLVFSRVSGGAGARAGPLAARFAPAREPSDEAH